MHDPEGAGFEDEAFDPDAVVWVRGVDYVAGWRDATEAGVTARGPQHAVHILRRSVTLEHETICRLSRVVMSSMVAMTTAEASARRLSPPPARATHRAKGSRGGLASAA